MLDSMWLSALAAGITSLVVSLVVTPMVIFLLQKKLIGQVVRSDGPTSHFSKKGTPTMGGVVIVIATIVAALLWSSGYTITLWLCLGVMVLMALIGGYDDACKILLGSSRGLSARSKLLGQSMIAIAALACWQLYLPSTHAGDLYVPFIHIWLPLGYLGLILGFFVIVGCANAVNLTDGLDGLVTVPVILVAIGLVIAAAHHGILTPDILVLVASVVGALLAFLWFNSYPAQVFMGDVGSLALGGLLGILAVITRAELLLLIMGGVFVAEAVSVMLQVGYFKLSGKRIFKMAPLHHHFELAGWPEPTVVIRFWLISLWLVILALTGVL